MLHDTLQFIMTDIDKKFSDKASDSGISIAQRFMSVYVIAEESCFVFAHQSRAPVLRQVFEFASRWAAV